MLRQFLLIIVLCGYWHSVDADEAVVAVASNFLEAMLELQEEFERIEPHSLSIISGSTGKLFAQIKYGAPFDLFLAADQKSPAVLFEDPDSQYSKPFPYAIGSIVLWGLALDTATQDIEAGLDGLNFNDFRKLAMPNPVLAPYGKAAMQVLASKGWERTLRSKFVFGENAAQAYMLVATGNAELGFIPASLIPQAKSLGGNIVFLNSELYEPVIQNGILLRSDNLAAASFVRFLSSEIAESIVRNYNFQIP
tara:strand:+ start:65 stop:817 length:753 start_codon:yes stop_codon:yes gene_type:complete